jgi:hypothetical protein
MISPEMIMAAITAAQWSDGCGGSYACGLLVVAEMMGITVMALLAIIWF